jgi:putative sterol carrier protein
VEDVVPELTIQSLMDRLPEAFLPEKAAGVNSDVHFALSGDKGGDWVVRIHQQTCVVERGIIPNPNLTFKADAQDCLDIFTGKIDGMRAFMQGKLQLIGDMSLAMRLTNLFDVHRFERSQI